MYSCKYCYWVFLHYTSLPHIIYSTVISLPTQLCISLSLCRKIREKDASKFHVQLCIAIFCMLFFFLIGIDRTETEVGCTAFSLLIQYFSMASVAWMGAESVLMIKKLIIVFGHITTKHIVIISIIAWCKFDSIVVILYI